MNFVLTEARKTVMEKHNPGENDLYMRTLELAQINEDDISVGSYMMIWIRSSLTFAMLT